MTAMQRYGMLRVHVELFVAWRGVATLVMLLTGVAVVMWLAWTLWAQRLAVAEVQARLDVAASASQAALRAGHAPAVGIAVKVSPSAGFVESLPQSDAQLGQIQTILRSATSSGLRAPQADFQQGRPTGVEKAKD